MICGWAPLVEAFAAGKFNLVHLLKPIPIWMRYNNSYPVKIMAWAHTNGSGVVVGGKSDIKSFADLGGKQIAVPFWYSMHNIVLQYALRNFGIKAVIKSQSEPLAAHECNLQVMAPPDMPAGLAAKKIDGSSSPNRSMRSARPEPAAACCASPATSGKITPAACCACTRR